MASTDILTFGPFHLDLRAEQLRRDAEVIPLPPKTFAVLRYLVLHGGMLVTREAIHDAIWGTQHVSDAALASCIRDIRQALGEQAQTPQFLETVRGRGFRFLGAAGTAPTLSSAPATPPRAASVVRAPMFMVGREAELAALQGCVDHALRGDRQIVFITGEPGIGKTTLVDALVSTLPGNEQGLWVSRGQCIEHYGAGEPYLPVLEALSRLGQEADAAAVVAVLAQYAPTWLAQLPALVSVSEREGLLRTLQGATPARMVREFAEAMETLTTRCPVLLILEDLHWCDPSTVELLSYLAQRRGPARLLVVGTCRPTDLQSRAHPLQSVVQELQARGSCQVFPLGFLRDAEVEVYLRRRLASEAPPLPAVQHLATALQQRTGGNPLFMVTMCEHLLREGVMTEVADQWSRGDQSPAWQGGMPESLRHLLERQVAGLRPEEQQLLKVASVAGHTFTTAAVAAGLEQPIDLVETWSACLAEAQQFLTALGVEEWLDGTLTGRYGFRHALYREALYAGVPLSRRVRWHRQIALRLEAGHAAQAPQYAAELAMHCTQGQDLWRAVHYLQHAGENALQRNAHDEAIAYLTQGLEILATLPDLPAHAPQELALLIPLGAALMASKGAAAAEVERTYTRARTLSAQVGTPAQHFPVLWGLWRLSHGRARHQTARQVGEELLTLAQNLRDPVLLLAAYQALGSTCYFTGDFALARTYLEQGLACYQAQPQAATVFHVSIAPAVYCLALAAQTLWTLGYPDQALARSQEATVLAQTLAHAQSLAFAQYYAARLYGLRRECGPAARFAEAVLTLTTEQRFPYYHGLALFMRGWVTAMEGQAEAGVTRMHQGLQETLGTGAALGRPFFLTLLAEVHDTLGQTDTARHLLAEVEDSVAASGQRAWSAETARLQGLLWLHQAEPDTRQAEVCFQQALRLARQQQARSWELRAALSLSRLWQEQGNGVAARQLLEDIYGWFTEGFDTAELQEAEALLRALGSQVLRSQSPTPLRCPVPARSVLAPPAPGISPDGLSVVPRVLPVAALTPTSSDALLRHEGDYWTLIFQGTTCRVKNTYGMHYLAQLLRAPGHERHALALVRGGASAADAIAPPAERARVNVTRAIRGTISRITTLHPACGQYLAQTIHTGTFCVYTPDPQTPVTWQV